MYDFKLSLGFTVYRMDYYVIRLEEFTDQYESIASRLGKIMPCTRVLEIDIGKLVYSGFIFEVTRELTDNIRCGW